MKNSYYSLSLPTRPITDFPTDVPTEFHQILKQHRPKGLPFSKDEIIQFIDHTNRISSVTENGALHYSYQDLMAQYLFLVANRDFQKVDLILTDLLQHTNNPSLLETGLAILHSESFSRFLFEKEYAQTTLLTTRYFQDLLRFSRIENHLPFTDLMKASHFDSKPGEIIKYPHTPVPSRGRDVLIELKSCAHVHHRNSAIVDPFPPKSYMSLSLNKTMLKTDATSLYVPSDKDIETQNFFSSLDPKSYTYQMLKQFDSKIHIEKVINIDFTTISNIHDRAGLLPLSLQHPLHASMNKLIKQKFAPKEVAKILDVIHQHQIHLPHSEISYAVDVDSPFATEHQHAMLNDAATIKRLLYQRGVELGLLGDRLTTFSNIHIQFVSLNKFSSISQPYYELPNGLSNPNLS